MMSTSYPFIRLTIRKSVHELTHKRFFLNSILSRSCMPRLTFFAYYLFTCVKSARWAYMVVTLHFTTVWTITHVWKVQFDMSTSFCFSASRCSSFRYCHFPTHLLKRIRFLIQILLIFLFEQIFQCGKSGITITIISQSWMIVMVFLINNMPVFSTRHHARLTLVLSKNLSRFIS